MPVLPFSKFSLCKPKPLKNGYVQQPKTLTENMRNKRLELALSQKDIAKFIGVCEDTITGWENHRSTPQKKFYSKILSFIESKK
jgi:DNA-binding XRE family transcriptional regulator